MTKERAMTPSLPGFDTFPLHAGQKPDSDTGARATPICQSASFVFPDTDSASGLFNIERAGHIHSRLSNPTNAVLEERVAALESGVGAIACASRQAAIHLYIYTSCGRYIVFVRRSYRGIPVHLWGCVQSPQVHASSLRG